MSAPQEFKLNKDIGPHQGQDGRSRKANKVVDRLGVLSQSHVTVSDAMVCLVIASCIHAQAQTVRQQLE